MLLLVQEFGRLLVLLGSIAVAIGLLLWSGVRMPWLGRLPGDIVIERDHWSIYLPIATSVVLSIVLTLVLRLLGR